MTLCPACGFQLWSYNHETLTCKHGHRWTEDGAPTAQTARDLMPAPAIEPYVDAPPVEPLPEFENLIVEPADPSLSPLTAAVAAFVGGGLVSLLADLILR